MKTYDKEYEYKGFKVKVKYKNEKSFKEYLNESINDTFIPKILAELKNKKL
ncbi:hypothetical protein NST17_19905 [Caldifermentibacillus hisashii]|uniref:Uncharacterized protein n=1 Tax=Caldifermentibacillus hisashii TaxID=996558 RepID=A0ABU9K3U4_9BACI